MKKTLILLSICSVILACTSGNKTTSTEDTTSTAVTQDTLASGVDTSAAAAGTTDPAGGQVVTTPQAPSGTTPSTPKPNAQAPATNKPAAKPTTASTAQGEQLISKSDCLACHRVSEKLVGPAYTAVATKYDDTEANLNYLADKIIAGGSGVWGEVPMTPHPAISKSDAKEMARYVLSLK
jgi:cytochrome c